jgi:two-component sensor histidine kinase/HAMP domain-containing protein
VTVGFLPFLARELARLRAWRARSLSNQITVVAVSLALAVASVFGAVSFVAVRALIAQNIAAGLEGQARLAQQKMVLDLELLVRDLEDLSENSFIANGLVDSLGRDTYLLPFLREHRLPVQAGVALVLCDYKGKPIASNMNTPPTLIGAMLGPRDVLATQRSHAEVVNGPAGVQILVSHPVVFPPTGQTEGVIVMVLDAEMLLADASAILGAETATGLAVNGMAVGGGAAAVAEVPGGVTLRLALPGPLDAMNVRLSVGRHGEPWAPLRWAALLYALFGIATVVIVFRSSRLMASRVAAPLLSLTSAASRVASGGEIEMSAAVGRSDEVGTLALALADMLGKLKASHAELEGRVRERTAALQGREQELERYARTQEVLLREVNHRVKNNLAAIIGVLHLEEGQASSRHDDAVGRILREMESRIRSLATVHAQLSGVEWRPLPLADLCHRLLRSSLGEAGRATPDLRVSTSAVRVDSAQAHNLALVLNELATNTLKYGRAADGSGRVAVEIGTDGGEIVLTYRDAGAGFPPAILGLAPENLGTGLQLIRGIVESSLGGSLQLANDGGAVTTLRFPSNPNPETGGAA